MDTSETYIKMSDALPEEIKKLWHGGCGDVSACPEGIAHWCWPTFPDIGVTVPLVQGVGLVNPTRDRHIPLFRQDQLQEMVFGVGQYGARQCVKVLWDACEEKGSLMPRVAIGIPKIGTADKKWSMEQFLLAFVMKELHNKVWNLESWVVEVKDSVGAK